MRIASFNLQNLRLRDHRDGPRLDPAQDGDAAQHATPAARAIADRRLTAELIARADADVIALQEVFDTAALNHLHGAFLDPAGAAPYPYRICHPGNDGRGLNVALMARIRPLGVTSHRGATGTTLGLAGLEDDLMERPIFRRDCLEVALPHVSLFVCHFKAPYPDADRARTVREAEARAVRKIIELRFPDPAEARWIVLGDFNEPRPIGALAPLLNGFAVDLATRRPGHPEWTFEVQGTHTHTRPDRILVSPRLAREYPGAIPIVLHPGPGVPHASDHALVLAEFPGL